MKFRLIDYFNNRGDISLINEMRDWKQHFLDGTKGMKKTNIEILNYVESLLKDVFENNSDKINNNPLAPWIVGIISSIGVENIDSNERTQLLKILEWFKITGSTGNVPKMTLQQAYDFVMASLDKIQKKKEGELVKKEPISTTSIPPLQDELDKKIERIFVLPDGSGRMWVKVLKPSWFEETCKANRTKGVMCQASTEGRYAKLPYESYTLIGPPKGNPNGFISTIASISINTESNAVEEIKQENNQHPGSQSTSGGWDDVGDRVIDFIAYSPIMKSKVDKFTSGGHGEQGRYGGVATLVYWMKNNQELFNRLMNKRLDIFSNTQELIRKYHPLGLKWFEMMNIDINALAQENPIKFLENIDFFYSTYGNKIKSAIEKINFEEISKTHKQLIFNILFLLAEFTKPEHFIKILSLIDFGGYIKFNTDSFKQLLKKLSNLNQYKSIFEDILVKYGREIISAFGNKGAGLHNFLKFVATPKLKQHEGSIKNQATGEYVGTRIEVEDNPLTGRREEKEVRFVVPDNLKILPQKERRDFIVKNKEYIESFFEGDEKKKEIEYLRFLFMESNIQDIERTLRKEKQEFINYYNNKFQKKESKFPGIIEFYSVLNRNKPNYIQTYGEQVYFPMELEDLKDKENMKNIILYYYGKSKETVTTKKKYDAIGNYVKTLQLSGEPEDSLINFYKENFSPSKITKPTTSVDYTIFIKTLDKFIDSRNKILSFIKSLKNEMEKVDNLGLNYYKNMVNEYSDKVYKVKEGDTIQYLGKEGIGIYLTKGKKYRVIKTEDEPGFKNARVMIIDDVKKESWYDTKNFEVPLIQGSDIISENTLRQMIRKEIKNISNRNFAK